MAAGGAAFTVKYDALTRQRWLPSRQFGKPVYLHGAGVMAQRLSRRVSGFNSPYAGPHFMVLFTKKAPFRYDGKDRLRSSIRWLE